MQPSGWRLGRVVDLDIPGLIPTRSFPRLPNTQFWRVGLCIRSLLSRSVSKGPCLCVTTLIRVVWETLGEVPHHKIKNKNSSY